VSAEIEKRDGRAVADCFDLTAGVATVGILDFVFARDDGNGPARIFRQRPDRHLPDKAKGDICRSLWKWPPSCAGMAEDMDNAASRNVENLKNEAIILSLPPCFLKTFLSRMLTDG
jgi:hypothetical protein